MSFKVNGKTIYLSVISIVTLIIVITFCVMTVIDSVTYGEIFKNVTLIIIGYFFNQEKNLPKEAKKSDQN